jgi:hypothetical protein
MKQRFWRRQSAPAVDDDKSAYDGMNGRKIGRINRKNGHFLGCARPVSVKTRGGRLGIVKLSFYR